VRFLAGEAGIRQIIDIGTGIPAAGNVHEVAGQVAPGTRVAYVDNDPIVHVHANALLTGGGTTSIVLADLREPEAILAHPKVRALIDFSQPVALLLVAILHFITGQENPARILAVFRDALPAGSYLALSHATADFRPVAAQQAAAVYDQATSPVTLRTRAQVAAFFDGWDLGTPPGRLATCSTDHMTATRGVRAGATLIICAGAIAGCGSSSGPAVSSPASPGPGRSAVSAAAVYQPPAQATLSWFFAINHKDKAAAVAHFAPATADQMAWASQWQPSAWPTFSALHCRQVSRRAAAAWVYCTFTESQAPSAGNPDSFWTVELHRQADGRWLITSYGQP
jgi:hypothetical protein